MGITAKRNNFEQEDFVPVLLIAIALLVNIGWMLYTNYTEEDAFITFRVAQNIALGHGFVYNLGEPLYGSTTPLLSLLLAVWIRFISPNVVFAARLINIIATAGMLFFTWQALKALNRSTFEQIGVLLALLTSSKLLYMNTQGMETPVALALLSASWYFWLKDRPNLAGLMCGLLLWTRIDLAFWVMIFVVFSAFYSLKDALRIALIAAAIYLPWVVFAFLYFGSPIPFTVTAKWVAYNMFDKTPYWGHLLIIFEYLSPFRADGKLSLWGTAISFILIAWGLWTYRAAPKKGLILLVIFIEFEVARLTYTRTTYFSRYFVPILWAALILVGVGFGALWERIKDTRLDKQFFLSFSIILFMLQLGTSLHFASLTRERQIYRHEQSLKAMGLWLKENTEPNSLILLEPLGYVGYYSERRMFDEVGLVTPAVVSLKREHIQAEKYATIFRPDYVIIHCGDTIRIPPVSDTGPNYSLAVRFDPLKFTETMPNEPALPWLSCYEIWQRQ
ncbi:MAG: hypothetical protein U0V02_20535 [Anaerolineales bacterium]